MRALHLLSRQQAKLSYWPMPSLAVRIDALATTSKATSATPASKFLGVCFEVWSRKYWQPRLAPMMPAYEFQLHRAGSACEDGKSCSCTVIIGSWINCCDPGTVVVHCLSHHVAKAAASLRRPAIQAGSNFECCQRCFGPVEPQLRFPARACHRSTGTCLTQPDPRYYD